MILQCYIIHIHRYRCKKHNSVYLKLFANYTLIQKNYFTRIYYIGNYIIERDGMTLMTSNVTYKAHPGIGLEGNIIFKDM